MIWSVEYTNEFEDWWETLAVSKQEDVTARRSNCWGSTDLDCRIPYARG